MSRVLLVPVPSLSAKQLVELRKIASTVSVADLKHHAEQQTPFIEFPVFSGNWPAEKPTLEALCLRAEHSDAPFTIHLDDGYSPVEELGAFGLRSKLQFWRDIEVETDMSIQLETGEISSPAEYVPKDGDD